MEIFIEREEKNIKKKYIGKASKLLGLLKINPETVIIVRNNEVISDDSILNDKDSIKILSVISGG